MGRPREPIDLVAAKGRKHLTKQEIEQRRNSEVKAPADDIESPSFLTKKEKEKYKKIALDLLELEIMSNLDADILARYIRAETEYQKISRQLNKVHFTVDSDIEGSAEERLAGKYAMYNYLQKIQNRLMKACNENARELGLTISSRCRLVIPKKEEKKENKFMKHA